MIVVISDLHFEEEASDVIPGRGGHPDVIFRRNLNPRAYRNFIAQMAEQAEGRKIRDFQLVIAGDLFDFNRTTLWFEDELRPYVPLSKVREELEQKILRILEATAKEPPVAEALKAFQLLSRGRYQSLDSSGEAERDFPADNVEVYFFPGNHDRVSNATPAIRKRVRELLGLNGSATFPHYYLTNDPAVLIRHGHEYDYSNFAMDLEKAKTIPLDVPEHGYSEANFGDYITIDVAVRLPYLLRRKYGDEQILNDPVMVKLYERLLQFDDVRPQSALFDYLLDDSAGDYSAEEAWERLVPVVEDILDEIHDQGFFRYWLRRQAKPWAPAELEAARGLLKLGGWRNRASREAARKISRFMLGGEMARPDLVAQREKLVQQKKVRLVVAGHTHNPEVCLIGSDKESDRFYINTGTWRSRIPSTTDQRTFGRMKALTYLMLFSSKEDDKLGNTTFGTFDYWTGYTRHFENDAGER
ncbi:MAG TPA: metallophosphoesterase [Terriglobales bacterium]|nr:metallophosphoesterase [Terriglobales bacterium]